jgi:hypothetical protein
MKCFENKKMETDGKQYILPFEFDNIIYIFVQKEDDA